MKISALFTAIFATIFSAFADYTLEDISPHLSTNAPIIWQAPTNKLPNTFWIYKKQPRVFPATTISNAVVLASFQKKGFPNPSTNRVVIWADRFEGEPMPPYFAITPENGEISFTLGDRADSSENISKDEAAVERAWNRLSQLGIDRSQLVKTNAATDGVYGVFLPRQIDGIEIYDTSEGFSFQQYGVDGKIRNFSVTMPNLQRERNSPTASSQQIIACIRAYKTPVIPPQNEEFNYFERIKSLANAKQFTITKITPYYGEGVFGETPTNNETPKVVMPIAELEGVADFGSNNITVRLFSPILSSEVSRLLGK